VLLLDGTPSPGFRSFLNFLAMFTPSELADIDTMLRVAATRAAKANDKCAHLPEASPPVLVALHHPLSVTQYPSSSTRNIRLGEDDPGSVDEGHDVPRRLHELLAARRVSLVISGHLHDAFGPRLHGFHRLRPPSPGSRLLEAESADWKFRRRFRLMSFADGAVSFTDARFVVDGAASPGHSASNTPAELPGGVITCRVEAEDAAARASPYLIHIVEPPDGRYFPARTTAAPWRLHRVVVSIVWTHNLRVSDGKAVSCTPEQPAHVVATLTCGGTDWAEAFALSRGGNASIAGFHASGDIPDAVLAKAAACEAAGHGLRLQVFAERLPFGRAASAVRPVHFSVSDSSPPLHMGTSSLESFTIKADWPVLLLVLYFGVLVLAVGLLVVTRVFRDSLECKPECARSSCFSINHQIGQDLDGRGMRPAEPELVGSKAQLEALDSKHPAAGGHHCNLLRSFLSGLQGCAKLVLRCWCWPLSVLATASRCRYCWLLMIGYFVYLAVAPHAVAVPFDGAGVSHRQYLTILFSWQFAH
jgi:hypothetical protein